MESTTVYTINSKNKRLNITLDIDAFISKYITKRSKSFFANDLKAYDHQLRSEIEHKSILVIGGAGTIGSNFIKALLPYRPSSLVVVDHNENGLTELTRDLRSSYNEFLPSIYYTYPFDFGSKVFEKLLKSQSFDTIACFAAHKHVRSEKDHLAIEAMINNNVFNTHKLLEKLDLLNVNNVFSVSTDKAANPVNVMGASKKLMESLLLAYSSKFKISTARFANVAFSNGSLLYGFNERIAKRQPLSAPLHIKRYFVSPRESGQLCMIACFLGKSAEIFFPKLSEDQMLTFSSIAEKYLSEIGMEPMYCKSENEARTKAKIWKPGDKSYPVYFFESTTSGEKPYEEFFEEKDTLDLKAFQALGIIKCGKTPSIKDQISTINNLKELFEKEGLSKDKIIISLKKILPGFNHIEKGKNLDQVL